MTLNLILWVKGHKGDLIRFARVIRGSNAEEESEEGKDEGNRGTFCNRHHGGAEEEEGGACRRGQPGPSVTMQPSGRPEQRGSLHLGVTATQGWQGPRRVTSPQWCV